METLKNRLKDISAGRVLDVGVGRGQFAWIMAENFKEYDEIIGIDVNAKILKKAEENLSQFRVKLQLMSGDKLEFEDDYFDTVTIAQVLHHIPTKEDISKMFLEMKRVLKPGGLFIVKEMFCDNHEGAGQVVVDYHHFIADIDAILGKNHFKTLKRNEILEITNNVGLESIEDFDFLFDYKIKKDKKSISSFLDKIDKRVNTIEDYDEYGEIKQRAEEIKENVKKFGLSYEKEVIIIGRKPL
ncbi:class I SAM-dependent methyltransferase [Clostridium sp. D2Q-11]|uniref:Class I SAM-dependent methyltransferase n=2 Tax=Anaeromonas frigoriresistens TaxID=2683708 RepID=A0A942UVH7_9FIRM|nr:class I SAM-dependent methyltransferase [Anaeromonas frigoriresistens]